MAPSSSSPKTTRKPGKGRCKIEIKKVEQTSKRLVTFSKRKLGLFRKAAELSLLCDSQIAVIVFSQFGKVFTSGYPDPDTVIRRYLSGASSSSFSDPTPVHDPERESAPLRQEFEEAMKVLEKEKKFVNTDTDRLGCGHGLWWNRSVEEMSLEEVMRFKECVEQLRQNVAAAAEDKKKSTWLIDSQSPPVTMTEEKKSNWLIDSQLLPMVTTAEEKKSTWLIDSQLLPMVTTAEEKKSTWLIDSQLLPMVTTAEEKKSTWLIDSQLPLPMVTTVEEEKCTWLIDSQSQPVTMTEEKKSTWLIDSQSPPMVTTVEEKKSTWLIDPQLPLPVTTAEEEKCTWLIDSQSPPMTTAEEKNSTRLIHSQSQLEENCTWLIDTQSPPWSTADQSMYLSMFDDMLEIDQTWESWNASNSCDSIVPYSSDLGQNWPLTLRN
ncbi:hypothetical protein QN277_022229 [Acacia crassicarpa]|uniref:MADS-box domain-containing protein n=1 Tax=Acacia crassicarpa TaxID=499986 RepID=A0AAE1MLM3_9FABA|nr:hypothetical protein QN277_022229 [Acacia crassicarpa]